MEKMLDDATLMTRLEMAQIRVCNAAQTLSDCKLRTSYGAALHGLFRALDEERPLHEDARKRGLVTWDYVPPKSQK